jgi:hypothetical protein
MKNILNRIVTLINTVKSIARAWVTARPLYRSKMDRASVVSDKDSTEDKAILKKALNKI